MTWISIYNVSCLCFCRLKKCISVGMSRDGEFLFNTDVCVCVISITVAVLSSPSDGNYLSFIIQGMYASGIMNLLTIR